MKVVDDSTLKNRYKYCKYGRVTNCIEEFKFLIEKSDKGYILVTMSSVLEDIGIFDDHDKENAYNGIRYHLFHYGIFVSRELQKDNIMVLKLRKKNERDTLPEFLARLNPPQICEKIQDNKYTHNPVIQNPFVQNPVQANFQQNIEKIKGDEIQNPVAQNNFQQKKPVNGFEKDDIKRMLDESNFAPIWNPLPGEFIHGPVIHVFYDPKGNEGRGRTNITIDTRNDATGKLGIWGSEVIYRILEDDYGIKRYELAEKLTGKFLTIRYNGERLSKSSSFIYKDYDILLLDEENKLIRKVN